MHRTTHQCRKPRATLFPTHQCTADFILATAKDAETLLYSSTTAAALPEEEYVCPMDLRIIWKVKIQLRKKTTFGELNKTSTRLAGS